MIRRNFLKSLAAIYSTARYPGIPSRANAVIPIDGFGLMGPGRVAC